MFYNIAVNIEIPIYFNCGFQIMQFGQPTVCGFTLNQVSQEFTLHLFIWKALLTTC